MYLVYEIILSQALFPPIFFFVIASDNLRHFLELDR